ncbi:hypothetical protein TNCV_723661 [Trichonephila clavipes]|nr:hypothetical protein TNCV_723661 [Trichonephila clavipes]
MTHQPKSSDPLDAATKVVRLTGRNSNNSHARHNMYPVRSPIYPLIGGRIVWRFLYKPVQPPDRGDHICLVFKLLEFGSIDCLVLSMT